MRLILPFEKVNEVSKHMEKEVFEHISQLKCESFEGFEKFDLLAFDWYDVSNNITNTSKAVIYIDKDDLFIFCEDELSYEHMASIFNETESSNKTGQNDNQMFLYVFFSRLIKSDTVYLDKLEEKMNDDEEKILKMLPQAKDTLSKTSMYRKELLRLKRYYEQLDVIFDEMASNDNMLLSDTTVKRISALANRNERYLMTVRALQDIVNRMCDTYQSQLSIQQNEFMKIFTIITSVFLPLTLITGWYGMNFKYMPELKWRFGYMAVIVLCIVIVIVFIRYFKRNKWM